MARYINSPGVQITEKDLSLRVQTTNGTNVLIPGFANQGPTSEPLTITSMSELESVYGIPTTPAEKYFYYSCKEVLNSTAQLNTIRLPYGQDAGADFANAYSGLFYPTLSSSNNASLSATWTIGTPIHLPLTRNEYDKINQGDFDWGSASSTLATVVSSSNLEIRAGIVVLNELQTVINEAAEGYYIALVDNAAAVSSDFDSVNSLVSLSANGSFANYPINRLDFRLSATKAQSDSGINSVSESLEKVGFIGFESDSYQDHLSIGVFKLRRSTSDTTKLTIATTEKYIGSLNSSRKITSPTGGLPLNAFIENVMNDASPIVKVLVNPQISRQFDWTHGSTIPISNVRVSANAKNLFPIGIYTTGLSLPGASDKVIGEVPLKLEKVLRTVENPENITIDVIADAGLSTIYSVTKNNAINGEFNDEAFISSVSVIEDDWRSVANVLINFAENTRKDCFSIIDPHRCVFVSGKNTKTIDTTGSSFTLTIYNPLRQLVEKIETNYAAVYANWIKISDTFTGKKLWFPFSGYASAIFARSDAAANTWAAPAGLNRGVFGNVLDIAFNPNQKQRDRLYELATNPVVLFSGDGFSVMGQKTLQNKPTAFDRINVRRLFLTLERAVQKTLKYFVFEPNTDFTRNRIKNVLAPLFEYAKDSEGVYDYLIVADSRNNSPDTIDNNELIVDIYIKPVRTAEFILVNFIATRTSQNFQELI